MPRKQRKVMDGADYGTPELSRRFTIVPKLSDPTTLTGKVLDEDEVDRMLFRDAITSMQHSTLQTLAKRLHSYGFVGLKSPDYSSPIHADATLVADKKAHTIRGAVHLIDKMDGHPDITRERRIRLVNLVLHDAPWKGDDLHACIKALDDIFLNRR